MMTYVAEYKDPPKSKKKSSFIPYFTFDGDRSRLMWTTKMGKNDAIFFKKEDFVTTIVPLLEWIRNKFELPITWSPVEGTSALVQVNGSSVVLTEEDRHNPENVLNHLNLLLSQLVVEDDKITYEPECTVCEDGVIEV